MPDTIADTLYPKKPPKYWIASKRRLGMSDAGWGRVWWTTYTTQRRYMAWLAASDDEWAEHGLKKPQGVE